MYSICIEYIVLCIQYQYCQYRINTNHNTYDNTADYVQNNDTCKYRPNTYLYFQYLPILTTIHLPLRSQYIQMQINTSSNPDQYKHQYRPIHTTFDTCNSTSQYRHRYCRNRRPRPHCPHRPLRPHPSLPVSQGLLRLTSRTLQRPQNQPHPLGHRQTSVFCDIQTFHAAAKSSSADSAEWHFMT